MLGGQHAANGQWPRACWQLLQTLPETKWQPPHVPHFSSHSGRLWRGLHGGVALACLGKLVGLEHAMLGAMAWPMAASVPLTPGPSTDSFVVSQTPMPDGQSNAEVPALLLGKALTFTDCSDILTSPHPRPPGHRFVFSKLTKKADRAWG